MLTGSSSDQTALHHDWSLAPSLLCLDFLHLPQCRRLWSERWPRCWSDGHHDQPRANGHVLPLNLTVWEYTTAAIQYYACPASNIYEHPQCGGRPDNNQAELYGAAFFSISVFVSVSSQSSKTPQDQKDCILANDGKPGLGVEEGCLYQHHDGEPESRRTCVRKFFKAIPKKSSDFEQERPSFFSRFRSHLLASFKRSAGKRHFKTISQTRSHGAVVPAARKPGGQRAHGATDSSPSLYSRSPADAR